MPNQSALAKFTQALKDQHNDAYYTWLHIGGASAVTLCDIYGLQELKSLAHTIDAAS